MTDRDPLPNFPWVESPFFEWHLSNMDISSSREELARSYRRDGYLALPFDLPDFEQTAQRIVRNLAPRYGGERRLQDAWTFDDDVRRIAVHEPILDVLRFLYGREPIPFQTLNFPIGTEQPLHCDAAHFNSVPERFMCGVWVALEDVDSDNGPLEYVPGSHRLPCYHYSELGVVGSEDRGRSERDVYGRLWQALPGAAGLSRKTLEVPQGRAIIWAANLLHGGIPQRDRQRSRHSQVTHYYFEDCLYYTPILSDPYFGRIKYRRIRDIRDGRSVENRYGGRTLPDSVESALDPAFGVNGFEREGTYASCRRGPAAEEHDDPVSLFELAEQIRINNALPDGAAVARHQMFLHPNDQPCCDAEIWFERLRCDGSRITIAADLRVASIEANPVQFRVTVRSGDGGGQVAAESVETVAGGKTGSLLLEVDGAPSVLSVTVSTRMAAGASNAFAGAELSNVRVHIA